MVERLRGVGGMRRGRGTADPADVLGFCGLAGRDDSAERAEDWREREGGDIRAPELPVGRCPGLEGPGEGGDYVQGHSVDVSDRQSDIGYLLQ